MIRRITSHLTYANVIATVALFIALGGSSYAAFKLPRNSVGSAQIRAGAVHSSEIKNHSIQVADLNPRARTSLRGTTGPQGPQGPQGPAGAAAIKYFAVVKSSGEFAAGNATSGGRGSSTGNYNIGFAQPVTGCGYSATLGTNDGTTVAPGRVVVHQ